MKACPIGSYMKGHHAGQNKSICCWYPGGYVSPHPRVDGDNEAPHTAGGVSKYMPAPICHAFLGHACFDNEALVGVHLASNLFLCED
jgi:hypothetical protein